MKEIKDIDKLFNSLFKAYKEHPWAALLSVLSLCLIIVVVKMWLII